MEALIAIGLASNVVQFLDFGVKLVTNAKELYSSLDSRTRRHADLELVRNDLEKFVTGLKPRASTDPGFQELLTKCCQVATELQETLENLKLKKGRHALWSTCIAAFKTSWNESQLQELTTRLYSLRDELQFRLIVTLSGQVSSIYGVDFGHLRNAADNVQRLCQEYPTLVENLDSIGKEIVSNVRLQKMALTDTERHLEEILQRFHLETMEKLESIQSDVRGLKNDLWNMKATSGGDSALTASERDSQSNLDLIQTFWYRGIDDRYNDVEQAHMGTFHWILNYDENNFDKLCELASSFEKNWPFGNLGEGYSPLCEYARKLSHQCQVEMSPEWDPCGLIQWLRTGGNTFWITGKPGSGKSTIMKSIFEDPKYRDLVSEWAGTNLVLLPSFFFWRAGSSMQRSQQGLLMSLLYQIFTAHPHLVYKVIDTNEREAALARKPPKGEGPYWNIHETKRFLERLAALNDTYFCLLIDGLDEFDGDLQTLAGFLHKLSQNKNVKILLSSRYLPEFRNAFQSITLFLHDWTRHDIDSYVRDRLGENAVLYNQAELKKDEFNSLVKDLLNKAEGVFIWVKTAISTILSGLCDYDTLFEIRIRLQDLPNELEDLYEMILLTLNQRHSRQTRFYLSILLYFLDFKREPLLSAIGLAMQYDTENINWVLERCEINIEELLRTTRGRLESRCSHLLTIPHPTNKFQTVRFMHRTVIDFLKSSKGQDWLAQSNADEEFVDIAATMGYAQIYWIEWNNNGYKPRYDRSIEALAQFRPALPWSRGVRKAAEQINLALQEWSRSGRICSVSGSNPPQGHAECRGMNVCYGFALFFLHQIWNKYWPAQSHIAFLCLWLYAGNARFVRTILDHQDVPLDTRTRLDLMTVAVLDLEPDWEDEIQGLLDQFCSQDSDFAELFWHRMFNLILYRRLRSEKYEEVDWSIYLASFRKYIDILITHGVNPNKRLPNLAFSPCTNSSKTALEILKGRKNFSTGLGADLEASIPLLMTIKKLENAIAFQSGRHEEGVYEHEWEMHLCEKECFEYCERQRLLSSILEEDEEEEGKEGEDNSNGL